MNDVSELKQFVGTHARAQQLPPRRCAQVLERIHTDDGDGPGSWVGEWSRAAAELAGSGRLLDAARHYNLARFPYVDGAARQQALDRCVEAFDRWRRQQPIERLDLELDGGRVRCWTTGLSSTDRRPLLVFLGGIVSIKEQWAPALLRLRRLGLAGVVTELPGVGENTLRYAPDSGRMLSALLDAVGTRAEVARTYAVAFSFSGHLALRCAAADDRIRGIVTAGAPVREFFTDAGWQQRLPRLTVDTLAQLAGTKPGELAEQLPGWALTDDELGAVQVPVSYLASRRDEIIPPGEVDLLRRRLSRLTVLENDDVHGSPRHVGDSRLWTVWSILRMHGGHRLQRLAVGAAWRTLRLHNQLHGARG